MYQQLGAQSLLWAFVDFFRYLALLCAFSIALVWCFKRVAGKKPPAGAH
jgi:DHA2 family multidrug resistance protein